MVYDALIIGGGPAGATTALLLAKAGWSVAIVEKKSFPRRKVCGEFISATSLPLLQTLGIAEFYLSHGGPEVKRVGLYCNETILTSKMPKAEFSQSPFGKALGREHLDCELLDNAVRNGAKLWQPWQAKSLERHDGLFYCTITANNEKKVISARIIIMANGSWEQSVLPSKTKSHKPSDLFAFKAHFRNCDLAIDLMPLLAFPGGYGGLAHTDDNRVTLSCCIRRDTLKRIRKQHPGLQAGDAVLQHIKTSCKGARYALSSAVSDGNWLASGPIQPGIRKRYADGIFYVGNIAGEAHPVIAEGISMAMQSAWLLARILIEQNLDIAGQEYTKQWNSHFANRIHAASLFAEIAMRPRLSAFILPILRLFPGLLTYGAKLSGKITQIVPNSPSTKLTPTEKESAT